MSIYSERRPHFCVSDAHFNHTSMQTLCFSGRDLFNDTRVRLSDGQLNLLHATAVHVHRKPIKLPPDRNTHGQVSPQLPPHSDST
jgi:hypothetical protein